MNHILAYDHVSEQSDVGELTREIDSWREPDGTHVSVVTMGSGWTPLSATPTTFHRWPTGSTCHDGRLCHCRRSVSPFTDLRP
jgi:hypothetical protein